MLGIRIEPTMNSHAQKNVGAVPQSRRINIAIVGAGRVGTSLAEELLNSPTAAYVPKCFIDVKKEKIGRQIHGIPVLSEEEFSFRKLESLEIQEIVFAVPQLSAEEKKRMYDFYLEPQYCRD